MRTSPKHLLLARWLSIALMVGLGAADAAWAAGQKQVLVLYSTRRDAQIVTTGDRELPPILERGLGSELDYYSEYIDQARVPDPLYKFAFREFLRFKYKAQQFDVIIAMHNVALEFVGESANELFPGTPVVYFSDDPSARRIANSTGIVARLNLGGTLDLAAELQPDARHVFVVSGAESSSRASERLARKQFQAFEQRFTITYLTGLPTADLESRVRTLPAHSFIYYLVVDRDGAGKYFHPLEYLDRLAAVANAPIYCWVDSAIGHGIVGGSLKSQKRQTEAVGELALRVLRGERADDIPISSADLNVNQVDSRQLLRWGISEARVPPGTIVMFQEPSVWDRYKFYILGAAALVLAQTALIAGLLVQGSRRRLAEEKVRGSQAELRTSYERIRDLGSRLLTAQDTERSRIARELHDDISQQIALLTIDLELLNGALGDGSGKLAGEALSRAQQVAKSVHDLSHRLHPAKLRLIGLIPGLQALQRELSRSEIAIVFTHDNVPASLPSELAVSIFRIVQEALQNALKYSRARQVSVHLSGGPEGLALTIADDGVGFEVDGAWRKGIGLISMSERLEPLGGTLEIRSSPGSGTRLEVKVPVRALPAEAASV